MLMYILYLLRKIEYELKTQTKFILYTFILYISPLTELFKDEYLLQIFYY